MSIFSSVGDYFALDIGTTAVRAVELSGGNGSWSLSRYGIAPVDIKISSSDSSDNLRKLSEIITTVIGQSGIRSKNVIVGIPSNKIFATVIELPDMPHDELAATIKYQAEQYIPMNIDQAKYDYSVLGKSPKDPSKNEILLASVANSFVESRLDQLEGMGLNVIAIEPDPIALTRALLQTGTPEAKVIVEVGDFATEIVVTYNDAPRLVRSIPTGLQSLIKSVAQNLNVQPVQAGQFIMKFGLQSDKLEGQVYRAVEATTGQLASEVVKSIKFFQTKYPEVPLTSMIVSNYGVTIPALSNYLSEKTGLRAEMGNPWQRVQVSSSVQTELQQSSAQFAVAIGLAQRGPDA
ncbi:MAG: type IV pilus assembly protein PilM [Candidatus Saccharimonadales bacterium]